MEKNDDLNSFYRTIMLGDIDNNTFEEYFQIFAHIHSSRIMVGGLRLLFKYLMKNYGDRGGCYPSWP